MIDLAEPAPKKRTKRDSPTKRTLAELRKRGRTAQVVERWNPYAKVLHDLFGVIDVVYLADAIVGVQTTSGSHHASRLAKILAEPRALAWIKAGGRIELWTWAQRGAAGKRKLWTLREEVVTADMFGVVPRSDARA